MNGEPTGKEHGHEMETVRTLNFGVLGSTSIFQLVRIQRAKPAQDRGMSPI